MTDEISIAGGGPAGSAAAIAALSEGAAVQLYERSRAPRHKVCGEFISPEACAVLDRLGVWPAIERLGPPRIRRSILHFGRYTKQWNLHEQAIGFSRRMLDHVLLEFAAGRGARISRGADAPNDTTIVARGRRRDAAKGRRLFGFKAHFRGPATDTVELYFTRFGYAGVSAVEDGFTNVCGLASERDLLRHSFQIDEFLATDRVLAERLRPLSRSIEWVHTGPLIYTRATPPDGVYLAGDALGFVDPFTGSGILNALLTGRMAGCAAAHNVPAADYARECGALLDGPFRKSAVFRFAMAAGFSKLALLAPGEWLYRVTRVR